MSLWQEFRDSLSSVISFPADYFAGWFGVAPSESGVEVNELTAMQIAAFVGCVRLISGAISTLPLRVWESRPDGTERMAPEHQLDNILNNQPNPETTAADFIQTAQAHILLTGNAFAEIAYNGAGQPAALYLRSPFRTMPYRDDQGRLIYKSNETPTGRERPILAENMVHVKGLGMDSLVGLSPVKYYAREVLGSDLAAQSWSAKFFANDSRPGGYLKAANFMAPEKKQKAVESWVAAHSRGGAHRMALLDGGITWEKVGVNPEEAQFLETRRMNREQIGCIFGVPVHFLGEQVESRADMEQRGIEFLTFTIKPWLAKWEQAINMKLFPKLGRTAGRYSARFDTTMFERATYANLLKGIQIGRYAGVYTTNEARRLLGEQPYSAEQKESKDPADKLWMPVNMVYVSDTDANGPTVPGGDKGAGQGGNDQSGGDGNGTGKPPRQTGQGGKRDEEIKRLFLVFSRSFDSALGRILARKKRSPKDFQQIFEPILTTIAANFSFRADSEPGDLGLPADLVHFTQRYIAAMAKRAEKWDEKQQPAIAGQELRRALEEFRKKCGELCRADEEEADSSKVQCDSEAPLHCDYKHRTYQAGSH
jgi:HK97 family phage portal protein